MHLPKVVFGLILFLHLSFSALAQSTFYAASKSGLNLREQPNPTAAVLTKIPYGAKVTKAAEKYAGELSTEGMNTQWVRVLYEGRPGYVADVYLLPFMPPTPTDNLDWPGYLKRLSPSVGTTEKTMNSRYEEGQIRVERHLHQNGMAHRIYYGYEYHAETIWIPNLTLHQGFVLARLLSPESGLLSMSDVFPSKSTEGESPSRHSVHLTKPYADSDWLSGIRYEWCDAGCYTLEIRYEEGEVSLTVSSGV